MPSLRVKLFQDGADLDAMIAARDRGLVSGYTTNPTLMRKAGISDYKAFARKVIAAIPDKPISFEVFSDDFATMEREAREIASWGGDTYIKIPITNTKSESAAPLISRLSKEGFSLNVTAMRVLFSNDPEYRVDAPGQVNWCPVQLEDFSAFGQRDRGYRAPVGRGDQDLVPLLDQQPAEIVVCQQQRGIRGATHAAVPTFVGDRQRLERVR